MRASTYNLKKVLAVAALLLAVWSAGAQVLITNVQTANVTPAGFSVLAAVSRASLTSTSTVVSVYADAGGLTNLAGQVGVEFYPLNAGDPAATNGYQNLLSRSALRQDSMNLGFVYARISSCAPGTTYYYKIAVTNGNGQSAVFPASGPLPAVTTAQENSFVVESRQLLVTVNATFPPGSIITLSNSNTPSLLAAVVGDGAGNNQVFFSVNDLISAAGGTNFTPGGNQTFIASVLGHATAGLNQTYSLLFTTNFSVGQYGAGTLGALVTEISIGEGAMLSGQGGSVPITLNSQSAVVGLSFVLSFPTNLFTSISVQPSIASVSGASVSLLTSNTVQLNITAGLGNNLQGNQQIAQLNLTAASNQPSTFVPIQLQAPVGTNADSSLAAQFILQPGRAVIIGPRSLLDLQHSAGSLNLVLYGTPGNSYQIQSSTNLGAAWSNYRLVPLTGLSQVFPNVDASMAYDFFRAYAFNADPPLLQPVMGGSQRSMIAYGIPNTNYTLLASTNLTLTNGWKPVQVFTPTNSFQYLTNLGNSAPIFYLLKKQ